MREAAETMMDFIVGSKYGGRDEYLSCGGDGRVMRDEMAVSYIGIRF